MTQDHSSDLIEVKVVYPSAHGPAVKEFPPTATLREVKAFALAEFGLREETVNGNQIVFFLFHGNDKLENLDQPLSSFVKPTDRKLNLRLAKETIAG